MSERRSLRKPASLSVALLLLGIGAITARSEAVQRSFSWIGYRQALASIPVAKAFDTAHGIRYRPFPYPPPPRVSVGQVLDQAISYGLPLLVVGLLSLLLVALGRRLLWLPVAMAGLSASGVMIFLTHNPDIDGPTAWSIGLVLAVILVAALPLLVALRGVRVPRRQPPVQTVVALAVVGGLLVDLVRAYGPWEPGDSNVPELAPSLALFVFGGLVAASHLRRRWLVPVLLAPALAVPAMADVVREFFGAVPIDTVDVEGPLTGALFLLALGAVTPALGGLVVAGWARFRTGRTADAAAEIAGA